MEEHLRPRKTIRVLSTLAVVACLVGTTESASAYTSAVACDSWARNYARQHSAHGQIFGGGFLGSALGLAIGAATGGASLALGAAIGGTVGILGGGFKRRETEGHIYSAAYQDCMAGHIP